MPQKIYESPAAALSGVLFDGMTIMSGGFGLSGNPESLIPAIRDAGTQRLTVISNNCGADGFGLWMLLNNGQIAKMISSYVGENKLFEQLYLSGELDLELSPQGTLAERIRAGGAGIPAFFTKTGVGTLVAEGKPVEAFDGEDYVRETWLRADLSIVKAWRADPFGNLMFRKTARNFNPNMATAGKVTVAEVEEIVPAGTLDPDSIHTPGIYVDRVVLSTINEKRIEKAHDARRLNLQETTMPDSHPVAVLVGSLRSGSTTRTLAQTLIGFAPETLACRIVEIGEMPLYSEDLDAQTPPPWSAFREAIGAAHAVLFVTPEYNRSVPGALKNAIDVGSRPYGNGSLTGKPAGVVTHSPGPLGGFGANHALRQSLVFLDMPAMQQPEAYIPHSKALFDGDGKLAKPESETFLRGFMTAFGGWVARFAPA